jgi:hypothetical protein
MPHIRHVDPLTRDRVPRLADLTSKWKPSAARHICKKLPALSCHAADFSMFEAAKSPQQLAAALNCSSANRRMGRALEVRRISIPSFRIL